MLNMITEQNIEQVEWHGKIVPLYRTSKGNPVVFTTHGWCYLHGNPSSGYDQSEVNEVWQQWMLYWNGV